MTPNGIDFSFLSCLSEAKARMQDQLSAVSPAWSVQSALHGQCSQPCMVSATSRQGHSL